MASPTRNDWENFRNVRHEDKVNILYYYLCQGYNMKEVAEHILGDFNSHAPQRVSNVTRCYGFSDRNSGRYKRYNLTIGDIDAFVRMYPNGCDSDAVMTAFVEECARRKQQSLTQETNKMHSNGTMDAPLDMSGLFSQNEKTFNDNRLDDYSDSDDESKGCGCLFWVLIIMVVMFFLSDKTAFILGAILPYITIIGVIVLVFKLIKKGLSGLRWKITLGGLIWAIMFFGIAKNMWENSGSGIGILIVIVIGLLGFLKKY